MKKNLIILIAVLSTIVMAATNSNFPLWDEYWRYDLLQYPTTQIKHYFDDLVFSAGKIGTAPASKAEILNKNYAGGKIRALFIIPFEDTRYPLELAARFDLEYDVLPVSLFSRKARDGAGFKKGTVSFSNTKLLDAIERGKFDVVITHNFDGNVLNAQEQERLFSWIRNGLGWVDLNAFPPIPSPGSVLRGLLPAEVSYRTSGTISIAGKHFISAGWPADGVLDSMRLIKLSGKPVLMSQKGISVAIREVDKGRTVGIYSRWPWNEAQYSLLMKSIIWAGRKDLPCRVSPDGKMQVTRSASGGQEIPFRIEWQGTTKPDGKEHLKLAWELRDENLLLFGRGSRDFYFDGPSQVVSVPSDRPLPSGTPELFYRLTNEKGQTLFWGATRVKIVHDISAGQIKLRDFFDRSNRSFAGEISFVNASQKEKNVVYSLQLLDSQGRSLPFGTQQTVRLRAGGQVQDKFQFDCDFEYLFGSMGYVEFKASEAGETNPFAIRRIPFFAPISPSKATREWQCGVWGLEPGTNVPKPTIRYDLAGSFAQILREYGINAIGEGVWNYEGDLLPLAREGFNIYTEYLSTRFGNWVRNYKDNIFCPKPNFDPPWTDSGRKK